MKYPRPRRTSYWCLAQTSSEKLPSVKNGNKCRDPQSDIMQRVTDIRTDSPECGVSISSLHSRFRKPHGRERKKWYKSQEDGGNKENKTLYINLTKSHMNSHKLRQYGQGLSTSSGYLICLSVFLWDSWVCEQIGLLLYGGHLFVSKFPDLK